MDHASEQLLVGRAFPELARVLRSSIELMTRRWEPLVRQTLPSADELTFTQIRDDLPKVLEQVAKALESDKPYATRKLEEVAPIHGETRFHQGFRLEELITEYAILRPIMIDQVTTGLGRGMTVEEVSALMVAMDLMTRHTTIAFVEHQTRQLQAANEAQSKYLSFLSHDLRGGLNGVCLMIEVLRRQFSKEEQFRESVEDLDMMRRSIFETIATMDRFLHAEKFRKGKVQVRLSRVNLRHLLMDVNAQLTYQAKDKGVELTIDAPAQGAEITSDKELLLMVLQNVAGNAVKYGAGSLVKMAASQVEEGVWRLSVADEGPGIAPEKLAELFRPFTRGETQGQPGVGLGLNIARQAADMLGAKLWAEPNTPKGTTFYLQLQKQF